MSIMVPSLKSFNALAHVGSVLSSFTTKKLDVLRKSSKHLNATNVAFSGYFLPNIWSLAGSHLLVKAEEGAQTWCSPYLSIIYCIHAGDIL